MLVLLIVLSPPCGMATYPLRTCPCEGHIVGSKPTVWDGDMIVIPLISVTILRRSKPTVWDGDISVLMQKVVPCIVLSPPCGMATFLYPLCE